MPSDLAYWLVAVPLQDHDPHRMMSELSQTVLKDGGGAASSEIGQLTLPPLKTGTLESLIGLSDELPRHDAAFTQVVAKIVDTLRALLNNDAEALAQHVLIQEKPIDDYMLGWSWNGSKYRTERSLGELIETLNKEMTSIDNVMKQKLNNYNLAKGQLQQLQRKKTGNLSVRSLADVVHKDDFCDPGSEYLETLLVAVPKNSIKEWNAKYERLTNMVVPRSSRKLAQDDEYALFNVTLFKKTHDDFVQKAREAKFQVRTDFVWDDDLVERQRAELEEAGTSEKELWTELLRLARTNFSEAYQALAHLKVIRTFVEAVLRFGLPAEYFGAAIRPNPKRTKALLSSLQSHYSYLDSFDQQGSKKGKKDSGSAQQGGETPGEYAALLEQEQWPFILTEQFQVAV